MTELVHSVRAMAADPNPGGLELRVTRDSALASRPDVSSLAMVAVYPTEEQAADLVVDGGSEAETMHCTLVFLGEVADLDLDAVQRAVASVARATAPLSGAISGVALFAKGDEGHPQVVIPSAKGLSTLRTRVVDALAAEGVYSASEYDWVPHMTLAYSDDPEIPDMSVVGKAVSFDSLSLAVADERSDFEFSGEESLGARSSEPLSRSEQRQVQLLLERARSL